MKKFFKLVAVLTALAATGFGLAACSDDDDDENSRDLRVSVSSANVVATYEGSITSGGVNQVHTFYFYSDKNFKYDSFGESSGVTLYLTQYSGTYTGDATTDGNIVASVTKQYTPNADYTEMTASTSSKTLPITITNGKFSLGVVTFTRK